MPLMRSGPRIAWWRDIGEWLLGLTGIVAGVLVGAGGWLILRLGDLLQERGLSKAAAAFVQMPLAIAGAGVFAVLILQWEERRHGKVPPPGES
jgi:hypothetical protein